MGGGMELAQKARRVLVVSHHLDKRGRGKLVTRSSLPLTARACVDTLITERALFRLCEGRMRLVSLHPDHDLASARQGCPAELEVSEELEPWLR
jgi:acyl CoA:acetate/3-ketoacid CoA transferase beta subunit